MSYSDRIDPYSVLNISQNFSIEECRSAYKKLSTKGDRRIRQRACLAYDILCNKEKYIKEGDYYRVKKKDCFYYSVVGDLNSLRCCIERNKNLLP